MNSYVNQTLILIKRKFSVQLQVNPGMIRYSVLADKVFCEHKVKKSVFLTD